MTAFTLIGLSAIFMLILGLLLWVLVIVGVLVFRQGLLVLLTILSPIAVALWILPNTEKYFRQWWEWFIKALMIYPIIAALFALSNALTTLYINQAQNDDGDALYLAMAAIIAMAPLFLIPFAFRFSGGIMGGVASMASSPASRFGGFSRKYARQRNQKLWKDPYTLRGSTRRSVSGAITNRRKGLYDWGANRKGTGKIAGTAAKFIGGRYSSAHQAAMNKESAELYNDTGQYGDDTYMRAATIDLNSLDRMRGTARHRKDEKTGKEEFQSFSGNWFNESQIRAGHSQMRNSGDYQSAFRHVMSKSENADPEHQQWALDDFTNYANSAGMGAGEATGAWMGISIPNQRMRADLRYSGLTGDGGNLTAESNHAGLLDALGTQQGFALASQQEGTFEAATDAYSHELKQLHHYESLGTPEGQQQAAIVRDRLHNAKGNLEKFVGAGARPGPPQPDEDDPTRMGAGSFGGASSASYKSEQAANRALDEIDKMDNQPQRPYSGGRTGQRDTEPPQDPDIEDRPRA
jgi:hypothetical protein